MSEQATLQTLSPQAVQAEFDRREAIIIDVREPAEYAVERIRGALLAPMSTFDPNTLPTQQGKRIIFHCGSGKRSERMAQRCLEAGFEAIAHMEGGIAGWKAAELPTVAIDPATGGLRDLPQ